MPARSSTTNSPISKALCLGRQASDLQTLAFTNQRCYVAKQLAIALVGITIAVTVFAQTRHAGSAAAQSVEQFRVLRTIPVPLNPHGIAFSPDGSTAYLVSSVGQALTVFDARTHNLIQTFPLSDTPLGIVLTPDGDHAAISHFGADHISRINLKSGRIDKTLKVGGRPTLFAAMPDGRRAFVSCESADRVYEIDLDRFEVVGSFSTGKRPFPAAVSVDSRWLFVPGYDSGDVTIIDLVARKVTATVKVGVRPSGGTVLPDGTYAVTNRGSNSISVIDPATTSVRRTLTAGIEEQPFSLVLSRDGRFGFVNNSAAASVSVLDIQRFAVIARIEVGKQPIVMAVDPSGRTLYVSSEGSHELAVVAIPRPGADPAR